MTVPTIDYDPLAPAVQADPYPTYARLRADAPVLHVPAVGGYVVSRHADVRRVMHDHATFSSAAMAALVARPAEYAANADPEASEPTAATSIIGTDGEAHGRLRTIVNRGFTPRRMAAMEDRIRAIARSFVEPFAERGGGDLQEAFAVPFPTAVIAELLGVDAGRRDDFRRWSEHMVLAVFEPATAQQQADVARNGVEMAAWLDEVIAERAGSYGDDLVSVLLRAELEGGALTFDEMRGFVFTLLVAGSITTAYVIGAATVALAGDHALQARARVDPALVARVVEESLRHDPPVQMMFRTATAPVEIAGVRLPAGATVVPLLGSANRDERVFPDPDRFDPDRDTSNHVTFGHGVHFCLGAALARLEARVALQELLARTPELAPAGEVERVCSLVFRGPTRVPLALR